MKFEIPFTHEGIEYVASLNHAEYKKFGSVEARSWNVNKAGNNIREFVLVEAGKGNFRGYNDLEKAAINAIVSNELEAIFA